MKSKLDFSVELFGDSGCFLPLYIAPFTEEQIERIKRYQQHRDFIGVLCYSCIRKDKLIPETNGMHCPHCGTIYVWGYGLLTKEEAEIQAVIKKNRFQVIFEAAEELKLPR